MVKQKKRREERKRERREGRKREMREERRKREEEGREEEEREEGREERTRERRERRRTGEDVAARLGRAAAGEVLDHRVGVGRDLIRGTHPPLLGSRLLAGGSNGGQTVVQLWSNVGLVF